LLLLHECSYVVVPREQTSRQEKPRKTGGN
jgi:hypothetical protein